METEMRRGRGFTLIELLVVIAIIAILAAILFPVFARAKESANRSKCIANLKQIASAAGMYAENFNGNYPTWKPGTPSCYWPFGDWNPASKQELKSGVKYGLRAVQVYVKNKAVFFCPSGSIKEAGCTISDGSIIYAGYSYWGNYFAPEIANRNLIAASVYSSPRSLLVSDIIVTMNGKPCGVNNHRQNELPEGGNIAYNDGHVKWKFMNSMAKLFSRTPDNSATNYEFYF